MAIQYRIGDIVTGKVTGIQAYGVFVMLEGGRQGLIHISECAHGFVAHLEDHFVVGQKIKVVVLDIDEFSGKISLSIRALEPLAVGNEQRRKHYWTEKRRRIGYQSIADHLDGWINEYKRRLN